MEGKIFVVPMTVEGTDVTAVELYSHFGIQLLEPDNKVASAAVFPKYWTVRSFSSYTKTYFDNYCRPRLVTYSDNYKHECFVCPVCHFAIEPGVDSAGNRRMYVVDNSYGDQIYSTDNYYSVEESIEDSMAAKAVEYEVKSWVMKNYPNYTDWRAYWD